MAKILVVEDDKDLNRFLSICLTNVKCSWGICG